MIETGTPRSFVKRQKLFTIEKETSMHSLVESHGESICKHFQSRADYLDMLMEFSTTAEEWFRIELLAVMRSMPGVTVLGTNHRGLTGAARPDFSLSMAEKLLQIELKVLPRDRNYSSGWQRFQAGSNNKKDFQSLVGGGRSGVIYVHWPDINDWEICAAKIREVFAVHCLREDRISCNGGTVILSYWVMA